ncbi:unnamed protein product [Trifolium pratense]|uniref:Uncharacterized protein n=1 Tax=Trifolium pratense TaxID=57577 RepID=A0ACB0IDB1_TRIPR|nr:unnamed protein product [Trifolium pratense]
MTEKYRPSVPKFEGYYEHWAMLMENLLRSKEIWNQIEDGIITAPPNANEEQLKAASDSRLKDLKVKNYLFQAIDREIIETILNRGSAKEIWDSMRMKYQGSSKVKRAQLQALRRDFEVLGMTESESVNDYFARTLAIANRMTAQGQRMEASTIVEKILRSLTPKFNYVVCSIEESNDVTTMSIDELQSSLLVQEQRLKSQAEKVDDQVLKVAGSGRGGSTRGRGRGGYRGRGRGRTDRENVECFKCHKLGHYQSDCPSWEEKDAKYAAFDETGEVLLMAQQDKESILKDEVWFLDSGCSNHMIGNKTWLFDFDSNIRESVKLGDDSRMEVKGKGNLRLCINGITQIITNVYYIPGLKNNLLSIGQLQQKGLTIIFKHDYCKVYHEERGLIMSTKMTANRMYVVHAAITIPMCLKTSKLDNNELWHCRYGHLSFKGLNTLVKKQMVEGLPQLKDEQSTCKHCLTGKQHREPIPKSANWRATKQLELVHSDICGPITPQSNGGNRYFITFTDDFSRKTWTYVLKDKSSAFDEFKKFKMLVEKESKCEILCLRTDRGGEFTSTAFNEFCSNHGIKRQLTTAYTPQQNGVSERKNRTLLNMIRSMLSGKSVPKSFWPEALNWATYILNRSPTLSVKDMTPQEAWSGKKPTVQHFRVFGCMAYMHIPDNHRKKLDDKSLKCILLGLSEESKAYKLYDPINKRVMVSRDVVFEEDKAWNWKNDTHHESNDMISVDGSTSESNDNEEHSENEENSEDEDIIESSNDHVSHDQAESSSDMNTESDELSPREVRRPGYLNDYVTGDEIDEQLQNMMIQAMFSTSNDPNDYDEAVKHDVWREAMNQEIQAIERNDTWELATLPEGAKKIGVKWIYKTKYNEKGEIEKHKARLVAKGYSQQHGIDYNEVFAPVARWDTIRTILAVAASENWTIYQLDVKSAFLHGELTENVYVEQPKGYQKKGDKVYKLKKALYGLKQAPRAWYSKIEAYFGQENFEKCPDEHTLFVKQDEGRILIVSLYVDDLIYTGNNSEMFEDFKHSMKKRFAMTDLGQMRYFLGVEVTQDKYGIFINQQKYAKEILSRFEMGMCNVVSSPIVPGCKLSKDENGKQVDATNKIASLQQRITIENAALIAAIERRNELNAKVLDFTQRRQAMNVVPVPTLDEDFVFDDEDDE